MKKGWMMSEHKHKLIHIARLRVRCDAWELENREILSKYSDWQLADIYNGIGSDGMPAWLRAAATFLSPDLEPTALIHDVEWHEADGTRESFTASNHRFKHNGYRSARERFGWADPRRYLLMNRARRFGNYCQLFGWDAWKSPSE